MTSIRSVTGWCAWLALAAAGCGDDGVKAPAGNDMAVDQATAAPDQASVPDQRMVDSAMPDLVMPDQSMPDLLPPNAIGVPCPKGNECAPGLICLNDQATMGLFPSSGYCTEPCTKDADCGPGNFCSIPIGQTRICFARCGQQNACPKGQLCFQHLNGLIDLGNPACLPANPKAIDGNACTTFADCNKSQACLRNQFDLPGGMCTTLGCTVGDDTTCTGGKSICLQASPQLTLCLPSCTKDMDCRVAEGYGCNGDAPKLCTHPHAAAGSSCKKDADCGPPPWACAMGAALPGGSCGAGFGKCVPGDDASCPFDTHCFDPNPAKPKNGLYYCAHVCNADADCRTADGYKCLPLDVTGKVMMPKVCRTP